MKLAYKAVDKSGAQFSDMIDATSTAEATSKLRQRGLYVTSIHEHDDAAPVDEEVRAKRPGARTLKDLAQWSRQLCVLVRSGTPLAQALGAIEQQVNEGKWRDVLADLRTQVEEGTALSDAMLRHPTIFDDVNRSLVAAGESSGQLGPMLERLSSLIRQQLKVHRTVVGAMVYPALLVFVGLNVVTVMLLGVLPRFSGLFDSLNAPLPPTTEFLMIISGFLRSYWWALLIGLAAVGVGAKFYFATPKGMRLLDGWMVRVPVIGRMVRSLATAKICRLLGVMLESRVPLLEALKLTRHSAGNCRYTDLMTGAVESATRGEAVSAVFARSSLINPSVAEAMRHGEQNGQIGPILMDMADFLDEENEVIVRTAMSLLEPLILIGLGVVVGFIALSLFIPLFDLTSMAGS